MTESLKSKSSKDSFEFLMKKIDELQRKKDAIREEIIYLRKQISFCDYQIELAQSMIKKIYKYDDIEPVNGEKLD